MSPAVQALLAFWAGQATDHAERGFADILAWPDAAWEDTHDFIQWLFPCVGVNLVNPHAPQLTEADVHELAQHPLTALALTYAWRRFLLFLGLEGADAKVRATARLNERAEAWLLVPTHNDLRITRVLQSLHSLGLLQEARGFFGCLEALVRQHRSYNPEGPLAYWRAAVGYAPAQQAQVPEERIAEVRAKLMASWKAISPATWAHLNATEDPAFAGQLDTVEDPESERMDARHRG